MDFEEVVKNRRSVRKYLNKEIPQELIDKILELANLSPSAGNMQSRKVIVVRDKKLIQKIANLKQEWIAQASVVFVICASPRESEVKFGEKGKFYSLQDATIFASYLQLVAVSLGLSSCWVGSFTVDKLKELLEIPQDLNPIAIVPVGYAAENPVPKERKCLEEIVDYK